MQALWKTHIKRYPLETPLQIMIGNPQKNKTNLRFIP